MGVISLANFLKKLSQKRLEIAFPSNLFSKFSGWWWWEREEGGGGGPRTLGRSPWRCSPLELNFLHLCTLLQNSLATPPGEGGGGFWSHLGCSGQNAIMFSLEGLV